MKLPICEICLKKPAKRGWIYKEPKLGALPSAVEVCMDCLSKLRTKQIKMKYNHRNGEVIFE